MCIIYKKCSVQDLVEYAMIFKKEKIQKVANI